MLDNVAKAECFNKFFAGLSFMDEPSNSIPSMERIRPQRESDFQFSSIAAEEVCQQLLSLDVTKSCGLDGNANNILRAIAPAISLPLARIFNTSLMVGKFPTAWKSAVVVPLFN